MPNSDRELPSSFIESALPTRREYEASLCLNEAERRTLEAAARLRKQQSTWRSSPASVVDVSSKTDILPKCVGIRSWSHSHSNRSMSSHHAPIATRATEPNNTTMGQAEETVTRGGALLSFPEVQAQDTAASIPLPPTSPTVRRWSDGSEPQRRVVICVAPNPSQRPDPVDARERTLRPARQRVATWPTASRPSQPSATQQRWVDSTEGKWFQSLALHHHAPRFGSKYEVDAQRRG